MVVSFSLAVGDTAGAVPFELSLLSSGLRSGGATFERTLTTSLSTSNQKGAPSDTATAETRIPITQLNPLTMGWKAASTFEVFQPIGKGVASSAAF